MTPEQVRPQSVPKSVPSGTDPNVPSGPSPAPSPTEGTDHRDRSEDTTQVSPQPGTDPRTCRVCGCTDTNACTNTPHGPCWWIADDLCSYCRADAT